MRAYWEYPRWGGMAGGKNAGADAGMAGLEAHKGGYLRGGAKYGGGSGTAEPSLRGSDAPQFRPVAES